MATEAKKPRKQKTAADYLKEIEVAKKKLAELEAKQYEDVLTKTIEALRISDLFAKIKADVSGASNLAIVKAIIKAAKAKDVEAVEVAKATETKSRASYPKETKAKALEQVKAGKSKADVAKEFGITTVTLSTWIKAAEKK